MTRHLPFRQRLADALRVLIADGVVYVTFDDLPPNKCSVTWASREVSDDEIFLASRLLITPAETLDAISGTQSALNQAREILDKWPRE